MPEVLTEASASGRGFLAGVCQAWEAATAPLEEAGTQVAHLRTGIVLASHGGALAKMLPIFRAGLGGPVGDGCQFWSWITLSDVVRVVIFLLGQADVHGAVNNVSPNPVTNREFTKALAAAVRRPAFMPLPAIVAKLMLGEMADETLLSSARVQPERLLAAGFQFEHRTIHDALKSLMPT